jgi:hypothetical protein
MTQRRHRRLGFVALRLDPEPHSAERNSLL